VYANLDRFNRVTSDLWIKDLATDRTFVNLAIAYDENSNPTSVTDAILATPAGTRTFDALYTMDGLDRVTMAEEGNFNGSTISTRSRSQTWSLSQTGNWGTEELDLDGTGGYETTNTGTFNTVNELLTRTGHSGITYDANGNLTDDGVTYDYVYDAWNRLRTVKTQAGATVAEYRYNGLNQRIGWHYDVDADNDVDSNDNWFYFLNDERWRIVASYRGNGGGTTVESDPKERFIFHAAGLGGYGGSSYIDNVILRDRDNTSGWNSSSDGTLEERRYYVQNWRADVVAIITDTAAMVERVKYSAYGVPFNLPMGDTDGNGITNSTDVGQINTWILAGTWSALGDTDLDGDVDATDSTNAGNNLITTGRGLLSYSDVGNRIGYAGYQAAPELSGSKWHVRNRFLSADTGRWNTRDPIGYRDGVSLYQYGRSRATASTDPQGLFTGATCGGGGIVENGLGGSGCRPKGPPEYGPPVTPPAPPPSPPPCERANQIAQQSDMYQSVLQQLRNRGCPAPAIVCVDCNGGQGGAFDCASNTLAICNNSSDQQILETLEHEVVHAFDCCEWGGSISNCEQSICTEARAYSLDAQCNRLSDDTERLRCIVKGTMKSVCTRSTKCCQWMIDNPIPFSDIIARCALPRGVWPFLPPPGEIPTNPPQYGPPAGPPISPRFPI
jgi:RHS repeat-associated protein